MADGAPAPPESRETIVEVRGLTRVFGKRAVLDGVDLEVRAGEVLGLIGPNGGGKSSLLLTLAGLLSPTTGTVTVAGTPANEIAMARTGTVGLLIADPGLYPLLTGRENLHFFGGLYGLSSADIDAKVAPLLSELDMEAHLDLPVAGYSSGMKQKVSLARALLLDPRLLLLDEPTSNLDPLSAYTIYEIVRTRADAGLAVVLCTHDLSSVERICDRVALFKQKVHRIDPVERHRRDFSPLLGMWRQTLGAP